jgi:hypothetical protein
MWTQTVGVRMDAIGVSAASLTAASLVGGVASPAGFVLQPASSSPAAPPPGSLLGRQVAGMLSELVACGEAAASLPAAFRVGSGVVRRRTDVA